MLIDSHCHLYPSEYKDSEKVIEKCYENNILLILNGIDIESNKEIIDLSKKYNNVYAAIGYDHSVVNEIKEEDIKLLEDQIRNNKITAIGEIGIDYYWVKDNKEEQKKLFRRMLDLAERYDLPVIIHAREAVEDTYDILKEYNLRGSMHCYQGSIEYAKKFIKLGFYIGIDGPITYKNTHLKELVKEIGINHLLVETDSPYLSPNPKKGEKNTSLNLIYIVEEISKVLDIPLEETKKILEKNTRNLFKI